MTEDSARLVKVAKVGDTPVEIAVSEDMSISDVLSHAGYKDFAGQVHAKATGASTSDEVSMSDPINGYDILVLTTKVKGGNQ